MIENAELAEKMDDGFADRLDEIVQAVGGPTNAAKIAGVSRQTLDQWRSGRSRVPFLGASRLSSVAGKSLDWLAGRADHQAAPGIPGGTLFLKSDRNIPEGFVSVPMLEAQASAGAGQIAPQTRASGAMVAFQEEWLRKLGLIPGRAEAMTAIGDSMEPTIRDGDLLLVDRSIDRVVNHGIYVVVYNGAVLVKRVQTRLDGSLTLISDNQIYREENVPANDAAELIIEGRVRWFGRMI